MAININLTISNVNNQEFTTILLRKFFNMVFIDPKGKTLHIYTATIFTGTENGESNKECPYPKVSNTECRLNFTYAATDAEDICFSNVTDSLIRQQKCIGKVWGNCEELTDQESISDKLNSLYSGKYKSPPIDTQHHYLFIEDSIKGTAHSCVASEGEYSSSEADVTRCKKTYSLACGIYSGVEAINWVKTTIILSESVLNKPIKFNITFNHNVTYYTPDFTWYFAPPANYTVDVNSTMVMVGDKSEKNGIAGVSDDTTVDFSEWVKDEKISERNKARVINLKELIKDDLTCLSNKTIQVGLTCINPKSHANKQFFIGLIIAFALSYCSDKTRLNDYLSCLIKYCDCSGKPQISDNLLCVQGNQISAECGCLWLNNFQGLVFPILILMTYITIIFSGKACLPVTPWKKRFVKVIRNSSIFITALLMAYVFGAWLVFPDVTHQIVKSCALNRWIIIILMSVSFLGNLAYILYCVCVRKRNVIDYL